VIARLITDEEFDEAALCPSDGQEPDRCTAATIMLAIDREAPGLITRGSISWEMLHAIATGKRKLT